MASPVPDRDHLRLGQPPTDLDVADLDDPGPEDTERRSFPSGVMPIMPLRNSVLFPQQVIPLSVGRERSLSLVSDIAGTDQLIAVIAQREPGVETPGLGDLHSVGTTATVLKVFEMPDGNKSVVIQGLGRIRLLDLQQEEPYLVGRVEELTVNPARDLTEDALVQNLRALIERMVELAHHVSNEHATVLLNLTDPGHLADFAAGALNITVEDRQSVLETLGIRERLERVTFLYNREIEILELGSKIQSKVQGEISRTQREYYLREQLKAIRTELGDIEEETDDAQELREKIEAANMPEEAEKAAWKELERLNRIPPQSAEYTVSRTYLDWLVDLPWSRSSDDQLDLDRAREVLDDDHYGLEKIKRRILEYLAVQQLAGPDKAPILCFAGPPGVGKTSLGRSIARAVGREFVRVSLGGIRDEAEIRGHRRTYIGALPGRVIQGIRKCGTNNPLFMLDEIDKLGTDFRGDPSSALLEVLDPEQNDSFSDHYIEVPFDLSRVMFIATANYLEYAPPALRDRMEILELPGYVEEEKLGVARHFLLPKQRQLHGLKAREIKVSNPALKHIVRHYTREAGVRTLERQIASVCRGVAVEVVEKRLPKGGRTVKPDDLARYLGPERFHTEVAERIRRPGIATGVAWTAAGGDILFVEASLMPGKGNLLLTGQLGDVMRESAQAALTYLRSNASEVKVDPDLFQTHDLHVHVPAGAVPKDGPSAGVTMYTALISLLTGRRVRHDVAMTGEITLRGMVLPVGGIKEKVLAAQRAGLKRFVMPEKNRPDLEEIPARIRARMSFHFVSEMSELDALVLSPRRGAVGSSSTTDKASTKTKKSASKKTSATKKKSASKKGSKKTPARKAPARGAPTRKAPGKGPQSPGERRPASSRS
jgi:ATP-dependent Lon protease